MGSPEQNKALVKRFIDALDTGDVAAAAACFDAEKYYSHAHQADLAGTWEQMKARRKARSFSDFESERLALIAEGDRVVHLSRVTATHSGEWHGVAPSGQRLVNHQLEMWRIEDDLIVEHWGGIQEAERMYREVAGNNA